MIRAFIAVLLFASATAQASIVLADYPPPAQYDHPPSIPVQIIEMPAHELNMFCYRMGIHAGNTIYACSDMLPGGCLIILPKVDDTISQADQDMVRRVEYANCNGWPRGNRD